MTSWWARWRLKSPASWLFTQPLIQADQRKYQSSALLAFVRGIHRWPVNSPHKGPVTRKMFPFWWRHHEQPTLHACCLRQHVQLFKLRDENCQWSYWLNIAVMSHECQNVSNDRKLPSTPNNLFKITSKKLNKLLAFCEFHLQRASKCWKYFHVMTALWIENATFYSMWRCSLVESKSLWIHRWNVWKLQTKRLCRYGYQSFVENVTRLTLFS